MGTGWHDTIEAVAFTAWIILGVTSYQSLARGRGPAFARGWVYWFDAVAGALFLPIVVTSSRPFRSLIIGIAAGAIVAVSPRLTRFCPACGATIVERSSFDRMLFCPRCGAKLEGEPKGPPDPLA